MAASGFTPISLYFSSTAAAVPLAANLVAGELSLNTNDGKLYYKNSSSVVTLLASTSGASGDVVGPASATDNALARFDLATGKLIQNSVGILSDAGILTGLTGITSSGSITLSSLTSGRVPYATTAGLLTDSANLTFNGTTLTANTIGAFTLSGTVAGGGNQINNVIIGTSTPLAGAFTTLTASTSITNTGLTSGRVVFSTTNGLETDSAGLTFDGTNFATTGTATAAKLIPTGNSATGNGLYLPAANSVGISTNGTNAVYIDSSQNVIVGGTSTLGARFAVIGTASGSNNYIQITNPGIGTAIIGLAAVSSNVKVYNSYATGVLANGVGIDIDSSGNVGIGTTSPDVNLDVTKTSDGVAARFQRSSGGGVVDIETYNGIGGIGTSDNIPFRLNTNNAERMRIDSSGNVGIGVSTVATNFRTQFLGTAGSNTSAASSGTTQSGSAILRLQAGGGFTATLDIGQGGGIGSWLQSTDTGNLATTYPLLLNPVGGDVGIGIASTTNPLTVAGTANAAYTSAKGIVVNYGSSSTGVVIPIGFSWSASISTQNPYWGMGFIPVSYGGGTGDLGFYTGGTERARIDSSGNVGIGTSSPASKLDVRTSAAEIARFSSSATNGGYQIFYPDNVTTPVYFGSQKAILSTGNATDFAIVGTGANNMVFGTNSVERMRIDSSGNVGIGTSSPSNRLQVTNGNNSQIRVSESTLTYYFDFGRDGVDGLFSINGNQGLGYKWKNNGTEAMRIDSSGNLLVGQTAVGTQDLNSYSFNVSTGAIAQNHITGTGSGASYTVYAYAGTVIGSVTQSGTTAVLFNVTSDQRLKENIQDAESASALIDALQVRQFDWKTDNTHQRYGFIAQELVTVAPEAVHQPTDPEEMMAVDYSKLVPMLVKEIQSLRKRLADAGIA